jgi:hypothetical protein
MAKVNALTELVCYRLEDLFLKLEVDLRWMGKLYAGTCPIHMGDNQTAINLYPDGYSAKGIWVCNTHNCQLYFKNTIIGFTRGVLSRKYLGWHMDRPTQNIQPFNKVIDWLCKLVGQDWASLEVNPKEVERLKFATQMVRLGGAPKAQSGIPRQAVRASLQIPATYYLERGYRPETLDYFDVGLCTKRSKEAYGRAVVPIYDTGGKFMVGYTARATQPRCNTCKLYHDSGAPCPSSDQTQRFAKWYNMGNTGSYLYNYWNAAKHIRDTGVAVIVESPGDVFRLHECGINVGVATFGARLTEDQQILLERSGAMTLINICHNDEAGRAYREKLKEEVGRLYKLRFIEPSAKDVGEMSVEAVEREIKPHIKR